MWNVADHEIDTVARQLTAGGPGGDLRQKVLQRLRSKRPRRGTPNAYVARLQADTTYPRQVRWLVAIGAVAAIALVVRFAPSPSEPPTPMPTAAVNVPMPAGPSIEAVIDQTAVVSPAPVTRLRMRPADTIARTSVEPPPAAETSAEIESIDIAALAPNRPIEIEELRISSIDIEPLSGGPQQ